MTQRRGVAIVLCVLAVSAAGAQQIQVSKENKTIAITTSGEAATLADTAIVTVGFQSYGKEQQAIYEQASQTSNAIVSALTGAGVPKEATESVAQGLSSLNLGSDDEKTRYAQGLRFQFSQTWHVTVPATQAAKVLQIAIPSGANNSGNVEWRLLHEDALQSEAAGKALQHAREIADSMAKGLGTRLGSLVYARYEAPPRGVMAGFYSSAQRVQLNTEAASVSQVARKVAPLALSPERILRSATVYAVFAIE